jgi:hypothetical protein
MVRKSARYYLDKKGQPSSLPKVSMAFYSSVELEAGDFRASESVTFAPVYLVLFSVL